MRKPKLVQPVLTSWELRKANDDLKTLRDQNKARIKDIEFKINRGYEQHGIIFTSSAESYRKQIAGLKKEISVKTKERNIIKKNLK